MVVASSIETSGSARLGTGARGLESAPIAVSATYIWNNEKGKTGKKSWCQYIFWESLWRAGPQRRRDVNSFDNGFPASLPFTV
jgi:hypothetical protein